MRKNTLLAVQEQKQQFQQKQQKEMLQMRDTNTTDEHTGFAMPNIRDS